MVSQATIIRNSLETNWDSQDNLNDRLSKVPLSNMTEIVRFFDREQVYGNEWPKAVVVRKINAEGKENQTENPNNIVIRDVYQITLYYRVVDVQEVSYSEALEDIENMATETLRILDLTYSPSMDNGTFWTAQRDWMQHDHLDQAQPELRRTLTLRLTKMTSFDGNIFKGFGGSLHFSSEAGHLYAEVQNIDTSAGYPQIEEPITGTSTPVFFTGVLAGQLTADMYLSPLDISSTADFGLNLIGTVRDVSPDVSEVIEATMVQLYDNDNGIRVTITTKIKVTGSTYLANVQDLIKFRLTGEVIEYPITTVGATP